MTKNSWVKLSKADKVKDLLYIPILRTRKKLDGTQMPYPSSYLSQKYLMSEQKEQDLLQYI